MIGRAAERHDGHLHDEEGREVNFAWARRECGQARKRIP